MGILRLTHKNTMLIKKEMYEMLYTDTVTKIIIIWFSASLNVNKVA